MKYILTVVCTVDLKTFNCFEMAPSDFPDFFQSLSSFDFPIIVIVTKNMREVWFNDEFIIDSATK